MINPDSEVISDSMTLSYQNLDNLDSSLKDILIHKDNKIGISLKQLCEQNVLLAKQVNIFK
jgi:hypothetical protein